METTANLHKDHHYVLSRTPEEAERLYQQSQLLLQPTEEILDQLDLSEGRSCLDLGCGNGDVMILLGQRVGPTGHVHGIDVDADLGKRAVARLNETGISQFSFSEADIGDPASLPADQFDSTTARTLLLHLDDPVAALSAMWGRTKPGGVMAVMDFDMRTYGTFPHLPPMEEYFEVTREVFRKSRRDPEVGSKIPSYFEQCGAGQPDGVRATTSIRPIFELRHYLLSTYRSLLPAALKLEVTTESRSERFMDALERMTSEDRSYLLSGLYVGVWKRKPKDR